MRLVTGVAILWACFIAYIISDFFLAWALQCYQDNGSGTYSTSSFFFLSNLKYSNKQHDSSHLRKETHLLWIGRIRELPTTRYST